MERKRRQELFTPKDRAVIIRACLHEGSWKGSRKGFKAAFEYDKSLPEAQKILWTVIIHRKRVTGADATVFDAMQSVEQKVANRSLDAREARMLVEMQKEVTE